MTTHPSEYAWRAVAEVSPTDDSRTIHAQADRIYRIATLDGAMKAPGWPSMLYSGTLIVRPAAADVARGPMVRTAPWSAEAGR